MPRCELIVARHGETLWNREGRLQGHLDSPLSPLGIRQAEAIAERLAAEKLAALYTSDLGRAYATAERIAAHTGHAVIADKRLRERHLGIFQGLTMAEIEAKLPEDFRRLTSGDPDYVIPEGESARERYERITARVEEIAGRHGGQRIVIVAHGGTLQSLFRRAVGMPLEAKRTFSLLNASLNTFTIEDGVWKLSSWGDVNHLRDMDTMDDW